MKKILMVGVLLTTLLFGGCTSNKKTVDENMTSKKKTDKFLGSIR